MGARTSLSQIYEIMKRLLVLLLALVVSSCGQSSAEKEAQDGKDTIVATSYKVEGTLFYRKVEKFIIEGHEYIVFSSKVATPPFVMHSESCPCKNREGKK